MRFLQFNSLLLCLALFLPLVVGAADSGTRFWTDELRSETGKNSYRITLDARGMQITGILMIKRFGGEWRGTLVNEFGVKAFDFVSTPRRCELQNVVPMMDKWYIRRTVAADIQLLMEVDDPTYKPGLKAGRVEGTEGLTIKSGKKELLRTPAGEVTLYNRKRNLTYRLTRIE